VRTTNTIRVPVIPQNPGIFAEEGATDPRPSRTFANVLFAGLVPGTVGLNELVLQLNSDIPANNR
jgi:hypothetical protein